MPRVEVTPLNITRDGLQPVYTAATADNIIFANTGREFLFVKNAGGGSVNVSTITPGTVDGLAIPDKVVAVPASSERMIGPFPTSVYNDADDKVSVDFSSATGVTYALLKPSSS